MTVEVTSVLLAFILGLITMVEYHHAGVLTVLVFYFFRGRKWWNFLAQAILLAYINIEILSGYVYEVTLFGNTYYLVRQGLALLALIPIWLYRGKQARIIKCYSIFTMHFIRCTC